MNRPVRHEPAEDRDLTRVISWFITIRWIACACVAATLLLARFVFDYSLPYLALFLTTAGLSVSNGLFSLFFIAVKQRRVAGREATLFFHVQILLDYLFLFLLVYFAGFLENPFAAFFVFHVLLTSFLFRSAIVYRYVVGLVGAIVVALLAEYFRIIPHFPLVLDTESYRSTIIPRAVGLVTAIMISAYLITSIKERIEAKGQRVAIELDRYKQLDRAKSNFILQVTHELRGPIAAVSGFHEMVLRDITGPVPEATRVVLEKADRRTENLLTIIDEMIDFAYMKSEEENRYTKSTIALGPLVEEMVRIHTPPAERKSTAISADVPESLMIPGNRDLLNIILGNLINNAIKYSPPHSSVTVTASEEGGEVHISVSDTGYGIEPDQLQRIFEEFYRTRRAREIERDGTGLGLPIVKRAVESLGGRITVYSQVDNGTTFDIYLPTSTTQGGTGEADSDH